MTKTETIHFMQKIKSYYQNFSIEDYVVDEWADRLKGFDIEEAYKKLDMHLNGEYKSDPPKLHYITNALKKTKTVLKAENIKTRCSICNQVMEYPKLDLHMARHNSINYIKSREHYLKQTYNEEKMLEAYQAHFDRFYKKFLEELYCVIENGEEKDRIERIIFTRGQ